MRNDFKTCQYCKYWDQSSSPESKRARERDTEGWESGLCKRYPPVLDSATKFSDEEIVTESPLAFVQPLTFDADWCGEWARKDTN